MTLKELQEKLRAKAEELSTLSAKEGYTAEDDKAAEDIKAELAKLDAEIKVLMSRDANKELAGTYQTFLANNKPATEPANTPTNEGAQVAQLGQPYMPPAANVEVLSPAIPHMTLQNYKGTVDGASASLRAYNFSQWALAAINKNAKAQKYCDQHKIDYLSHFEGDNATGGYLVPTQVSSDIIDIRNAASPFRQFAQIKAMTSDSWEGKQRKGGLTAYPVGEGKTGTKSYVEFGDVKLTARKWLVDTDNSTELGEDVAISWADEMTGEIARAFAVSESEAGFFGDGTSTYHRIMGVIPAIQAVTGTVTQNANIQVASGNLWSEITLGDLIAVTARIGSRYISGGNLRWYCSQQFYTNVMVKLAMAAGGNAAAEIVNGVSQFSFLGSPVQIMNNFPISEDNSQIPLIYGDLSKAVMFGDRKGVGISQYPIWDTDEIGWRGRERFDISVWNLGNAAASAADYVFGPLAALQTAAS